MRTLIFLILILILLLTITGICFVVFLSEHDRIVDVEDVNLFELRKGRYLRLIGIEPTAKYGMNTMNYAIDSLGYIFPIDKDIIAQIAETVSDTTVQYEFDDFIALYQPEEESEVEEDTTQSRNLFSYFNAFLESFNEEYAVTYALVMVEVDSTAWKAVDSLVNEQKITIEYCNSFEPDTAFTELTGYVLLEDGTDLGAWILEHGYAQVNEEHNHPRKDAYLALQQQAQENGLGIWAVAEEAEAVEMIE